MEVGESAGPGAGLPKTGLAAVSSPLRLIGAASGPDRFMRTHRRKLSPAIVTMTIISIRIRARPANLSDTTATSEFPTVIAGGVQFLQKTSSHPLAVDDAM